MADYPPTVGLGPGGQGEASHGAPPAKSEDAPQRGEQIGRFVVLDILGVGGMGVVVSAYDPKLDRKVALKLLRPGINPEEGSAGARARLLREAQAMAKLRHPNVVAVYEVGEYRDQVFIAMEHVPGGNLVRWADKHREAPGGWRQIVDAYVDAGRGLLAAHREGLVHRDFKPANVLVDEDRFQVTDFGIASIGGREVLDDLGLVPPPDHERSEPTSASQGLLGTAPYMAPELIEGEPADAKSDQFAFCVALFESLYGHRPFVGENNAAIVESIVTGKIQRPVRERHVPQWVRDALMRGLSTDAAARWPSMADLLATLRSPDEAEVGRRTRVVIAAAIGVAFVALPLVFRALGPPFDRSTYAGVVTQTLSLIALLLLMAYAARGLVAATALNRKAFFAVVTVLGMQLPLELSGAALGVPVVATDTLHLVLWGAMATMFAVTVDRRFVALGAAYLAFVPIAVHWPAYHLHVLGLSNAVFVAFVLLVWRAGAITPGARR